MHISFSSIDTFEKCAYQFKLKYIDKVSFDKGNLYSAFGHAIHSTLQTTIVDPKVFIEDTFKHFFKTALKKLPFEIRKNIFIDPDQKRVSKEMAQMGAKLCKMAKEKLEEKFPEYKVVSVEQRFEEPLIEYKGNKDFEFVGSIDIIIETPDGKYHIIDWKTSSWGWDARDKTNKMKTYQLVYYKHYFCLQTGALFEDTKAHFALLKRTAKKDNIEIFEVPVGQKKVKNALKVLNNILYNVEHNNFPKNKTSCKFCEFYHTQHCNAK